MFPKGAIHGCPRIGQDYNAQDELRGGQISGMRFFWCPADVQMKCDALGCLGGMRHSACCYLPSRLDTWKTSLAVRYVSTPVPEVDSDKLNSNTFVMFNFVIH